MFAQDHSVSYGPRRHMHAPGWVSEPLCMSQRFRGRCGAVNDASIALGLPSKY